MTQQQIYTNEFLDSGQKVTSDDVYNLQNDDGSFQSKALLREITIGGLYNDIYNGSLHKRSTNNKQLQYAREMCFKKSQVELRP